MPLIPKNTPPYYTTQDGGTGTTPIQIYRALLNQTGTSAPTAIVLQDTIGGITFTYGTVGRYNIVKTGAFLQNKTWYSLGNGTSEFGNNNILWSSVNELQLWTGEIEAGSVTLLNDYLFYTPLEILIFQ